MGGQQSSRKITIDNEDTNNVIKVSEKVVERLKGSIEEESKQNAQPNPPRSFNPVQVHPQKIPLSTQDPSAYPQNQAQVIPVTTTAIDIKKHYEEELAKNNVYWQNRLREVEKSQDRINNIWKNEYRKALEEAENNPMIPSKDKETLPCGGTKSVVIDCYKKNGDQPLVCANEVQAFSDCVNSVRFRKSLNA